MKITSLGEYKSIPAFVAGKLAKYDAMEHSFPALFDLMFSERENVFFEKSNGYEIEYTTYGEAYDRILRCAGGLKRLTSSLPADSVIGLYMENGVDWFVAFWSILNSGHRPLLLNSRTGEAALLGVMAESGARLVISDGRTLPGYETLRLEDIPEKEALEPGGPFGSELLFMSSGTTAAPKLCAYSQEELYWQILDSRDVITQCRQIKKHYKGKLKLLAFLPFYHIFGFIAVYVWFAFFSRTLVQLNDLSGQTILNTIRRHEVTHVFAVPLFWNEVHRQAVKTIRSRGDATWQRFRRGLALAEKVGDIPLIGGALTRRMFREVRDNLFGESVLFMVTGGSEITSEVLSFFNLIGYRLANGYGATETGITSVELSPRRSIRNSGFVGAPLPSAEYAIGEDGVLLVKGRAAAKYVLENGRKTPRPQWFRTQDLAECVNGHYRILGRADDLVVGESGENLNPCLIEPLLNTGSSYETCLIAGRESGETVPTLLVYAGSRITAARYDAVREDIAKKLQRNNLSAQIRRIVFLRRPLMAEGEIKLNRARLARARAEGALLELDPAGFQVAGEWNDETADYLKALFAAAFERSPAEIDMDLDFFLDGGGSSLDYFAMVSKIQEDFDVRLPRDEMLTTPRALYEYVMKAQRNVD